MYICFHNWTNWSREFQGEVTRSRGSFGQYSRDPVVLQKRECIKCNWVDSRIVYEGKLEKEQT